MVGNTIQKVARTIRRSFHTKVVPPRRPDLYKIMTWLVGIVFSWGILMGIVYCLVYLFDTKNTVHRN
jgi:hypothetical protein